ncbi:MAG TPA: hypothetical protein EYO90_03575 [Candidatus Latescibacteria bacterium]|nr:hypothetical protein [Candidatus Latescibacterota bacterium]
MGSLRAPSGPVSTPAARITRSATWTLTTAVDTCAIRSSIFTSLLATTAPRLSSPFERLVGRHIHFHCDHSEEILAQMPASGEFPSLTSGDLRLEQELRRFAGTRDRATAISARRRFYSVRDVTSRR